MKSASHFGRFLILLTALTFSKIATAQAPPDLTGKTPLMPLGASGQSGPDLTGNTPLSTLNANAQMANARKGGAGPDLTGRMPLAPPGGSVPVGETTRQGFSAGTGFGLLGVFGVLVLGAVVFLKKSK